MFELAPVGATSTRFSALPPELPSRLSLQCRRIVGWRSAFTLIRNREPDIYPHNVSEEEVADVLSASR